MNRFFCYYFRIGLIALVFIGLSGLARAQGTYYDAPLKPSYRGYVHDTRLWIPKNVSVIRGVIVLGNGANGDQRGRTEETDWQALARAHDFALMGTSLYICQSVNDVNAEVPMLLADLAWYATASGHPEVAHLPFVLAGWSGGGQMAYGINTKIPERVIAYIMNKGAYYVPGALSPAALKTPSIGVGGQFDLPEGRTGIIDKFKANRPSGGLCALAVEHNTGHAEGNVDGVFFTFFDHAIRARYPAGATPLSGPVTLLDLTESNGWLANEPTVSSGLSGSVYPYATYSGDKTTACWLMDADVANLYRGFATYNPAVTVTPVGGPLFSASQMIEFRVSVNSAAFPDWTSADVYDGAFKLGTVNKGGAMSVYAVRPWGGRGVTAIARDASGNERTSIPQPFVVNKNSAFAWNNGSEDFLWNTTSTNWGGAVWSSGADAVFGATGVGMVTVSGTQTLPDSLMALIFDAAGYKLTGGTLAMPANPGIAGFNVNADAEIASVISGSGGLNKTGAGTLTLTGSNTHSGITAVKAGSLKLGNGGNHGDTRVFPGATVAIAQNANGTTNALNGLLLWLGANLTMADGYTSTLNVGWASLSAQSGASPTLTFDVASTTQTSDRLAISGTASIDTNALPTIVANFLAAPSDSTKTYTLITAASGLGGAAKFNFATKNFIIGGNPYHTSLATSTDTAVILSFEAGATISPFYWQGGIDGSWKSQNSGTLDTNFTSEAAGAANRLELPSLGSNVFMTATSASNLTTTLDQAFAINGLTFVGTGSSNTAGSSIGAGAGGTLQINGGGITVNAGSGANTISAPVTLGAAQSWNNNSSNMLTVGTGIVNNGGYLLTVAGSGNTTISGAMSGNGSLTQSGSGTLTLSGSNTYTGATTVNAGTLAITGSAALAGGGTVNLVGGTLNLGGASITNPISFQGGNLAAGTVTLNSGNFDIQTGMQNYNASFTGSAGLIKSTAGTAVLSGYNTYTGATTINAGTLAITRWASFYANNLVPGTSVVNIKAGGTLDLGGVGTGNYAVTGNYPAIFPISLQGGTLQNGVVNYTGGNFDIQSGTETSTAVLTNHLWAPAGLIKSTAGTAVLSGYNTYTGTTMVTGGLIQLNVAENPGTSGPLGNPSTLANSIILQGGGLQFTANNTYDYTTSGRLQLADASAGTIDTNGQDVTFANALRVGTAKTGGLTKSGLGTLTLAGNNTYTGATTINAGTLQLDGSIAGNLTVQAGGRLIGSGTIGGNLTVASGGVAEFSGGIFVVNGGITNNGLVILSNGARISGTSSSFVNNGTLDVITAGTFTPPPGFQNNGVVLDSSAVRVASVSRSGNDVTVRINSNTGHTYRLQYSPTLSGGSFENIGSPQTGTTGTILEFTHSSSADSGFYRVTVNP